MHNSGSGGGGVRGVLLQLLLLQLLQLLLLRLLLHALVEVATVIAPMVVVVNDSWWEPRPGAIRALEQRVGGVFFVLGTDGTPDIPGGSWRWIIAPRGHPASHSQRP